MRIKNKEGRLAALKSIAQPCYRGARGAAYRYHTLNFRIYQGMLMAAELLDASCLETEVAVLLL